MPPQRRPHYQRMKDFIREKQRLCDSDLADVASEQATIDRDYASAVDNDDFVVAEVIREEGRKVPS